MRMRSEPIQAAMISLGSRRLPISHGHILAPTPIRTSRNTGCFRPRDFVVRPETPGVSGRHQLARRTRNVKTWYSAESQTSGLLMRGASAGTDVRGN